jgi:hypothetical protein
VKLSLTQRKFAAHGACDPEPRRMEGWSRRKLLVAAGALSLSGLHGTTSEAQSGGAIRTDRKTLNRIDVHHHSFRLNISKKGLRPSP